MDWTQASWFEVSAMGVGVLTLLVIATLFIGSVLWAAYDFAKSKIAQTKRKRNHTYALRCDACAYNVKSDGGVGVCGKFNHSISGSVYKPGCTWGMRRHE